MKLFSKSLTATDCLKRLSIPKRVLTSLPEFHGGHAVELHVRYETMEWPLVCTTRKNGYKKPVFSKGWRKFVLRNSLNVGDKLTLYKEEDESGSLHYRVEVKRATRPSRALSQSPPPVDHDLDESHETTGARSCRNVEEKRVPVANCTYQTSAGITSCSPLYQFGFTVADIASVRGTEIATDETNNSLFKQLSVDMSDVGDVNINQENSKSQYSTEKERELKLFGAIVGGALVVGTNETKAYHNCLKQLGLYADGAELVSCNNQASLIRNDGAKEETAVREYFNLGLTVDGAVVHVHDDDQATSSTSFYKTDQRLGVGQSIEDRTAVNLDLTL